jgi:small subunit ribosomal protein S18
MARDRDRDRDKDRKRGSKDAPRKGKKKVCIFCSEHIAWVDYKDTNILRRFMSERGKIRARRVTGNCDQHQRDISIAIKTARELALLPYTQRTVSERGPGRGGRGGGPRFQEAAPAAADAEGADVDVDLDDLVDPGDVEQIGDELVATRGQAEDDE